MAHSVLSSVTSLFKLLFVVFSFFAFNVSNAQCPGPIVVGGVTFVPLNGGVPFAGNNHCYYISTTGGDLGNGRFHGIQIAGAVAGTGGYAATLHTAGENAFVANAIFAFNGGLKAAGMDWGSPRNAWIGFADAAIEATWVWSSGEPVCYTNWNTDEPNDFAIGEDYAEMLIMDDYPGFTPFGKWNDWFNVNIPPDLPGAGPTRLPIILEVGSLVRSCEPIGDQGCTLGYWKNHEEDWQGYTTGQTLESVFNVPDVLGMDNFTLMQALSFGGGPGVGGGARNLFKQAVAALLNSAHSDVNYPLTTAQVIAQVNVALATLDRNTMLALAVTLDGYNNLHNNDLCGDSSPRRLASDLSGPSASDLTGPSGEKQFAISGYPNPSRASFSIQINGLSTEKVAIRVTDMTGRLIEQRTNLAANQIISLGNTYRAGLYYVEVSQGDKKQQIKLIKQ